MTNLYYCPDLFSSRVLTMDFCRSLVSNLAFGFELKLQAQVKELIGREFKKVIWCNNRLEKRVQKSPHAKLLCKAGRPIIQCLLTVLIGLMAHNTIMASLLEGYGTSDTCWKAHYSNLLWWGFVFFLEYDLFHEESIFRWQLVASFDSFM